MMRASKPRDASFRAQWWALELASMAIRQPAGSWAHQAMNLSRASGRLVTTLPNASTAWIWMTFFAKSAPTRVISVMGLLLRQRFQIEFNNPIVALDAVAWKWEVPSYSAQAERQRQATRPGRRYAVNFRQPGPGVLPSSPA